MGGSVGRRSAEEEWAEWRASLCPGASDEVGPEDEALREVGREFLASPRDPGRRRATADTSAHQKENHGTDTDSTNDAR
jgi:hypothetical protein